MLLTIILILDIILMSIFIKRFKRYEKALEEIASGRVGYTRMISIALKALYDERV